MAKRPMCLLCFLMVLSLGALELMGIPLIRGNPLPLNVQEQIEAHPGSMICGEVEQYENTEFSQSVYLKKTYLIHQSKKFPIENVRIFLKKEEDLKPGMRILVKGTLKRVEGPANPGGFDSQQYYACRHIYYFMKNAVLQKKTAVYSGYRQLLLEIKESCRQILKEAAGKDAPVFCAMTLGDKQELDPETQMRYQLAGIIHILAISGLHISILGMGLYNLLKKMGLGIWPAGIFSLGVMLQYGIMTGGSVSTMRAVTMFLIAMGARITGRIYDMMSALSVTAMMILVESPASPGQRISSVLWLCSGNGARCGKDLCPCRSGEKMDKGTGKSYSSSACDFAGDAEVFRRSLYCRIYPESVGASKCGGSADWRNGGAAAGNSQYSCGKTGNPAGKGTAAFL